MEKNQHEAENDNNRRQDQGVPANAPGQQLPSVSNDATKGNNTPHKEEHSESSLPQQNNETLGTP